MTTLAAAAEQQICSQIVAECAPAIAPDSPRILIIDDVPAIHNDFRKILEKVEAPSLDAARDALFGSSSVPSKQVNFVLDSAYQGQEGLALVERALKDGRPYAVAFVDIRMPPGWDGIETIARLWAADPDLQVVICTAYSDYSWDQVAERFGCTDSLLFLKKPFDSVEVMQLAHALTRKWLLTRQAKSRVADLDRMVSQRTQDLRALNDRLLLEMGERKQAQVRLSAFSALGQHLSAAPTAKAAGQVIVDAADQLLGWDACLLDLYPPGEDILCHVLNADLIDGRRTEFPPRHDRRPPTGLARRAIQEGGQLVLRADPIRMGPEALPFGDTSRPSASLMFVPIRNGTNVIGILSIQSYTPNAYSQRSLETLQALADHCGGALDRIRNEEAMHASEARYRLSEAQLRQSQKMEAVGHLAGGIAHDFNNLLAVIRGNSELVLMTDGQLSDTVSDCLKQVVSASDRAANLTRQLLTFSRKQVMQPQPLDLNEVIGNFTRMLKRIIGEDLQLQCTYAARLPAVRADVGMLEQVLVNLAVNARDAMPKGGQLLILTEFTRLDVAHTSAHPEARTGDFVCLSVTDTGTGIAAEHLPRLFEPFFTTKEVGKGSGLGLATVYGIVQQHEGWIEVASQLGAGSTFKIFLPAIEPSPAAVSATEPVEAKAAGGSETILLVEDDEAVRSLTSLILKKAGYHLHEAASGPQALELWRAHKEEIALVLTDMIMPERMNGRELAEQLLAERPALKVIFMSGYSGETVGKDTAFLRRTRTRFLQKPCHWRTLLQTVRKSLDEKRDE
jgi:signal transduction histidine kinase/FixJ family two-component response regulator